MKKFMDKIHEFSSYNKKKFWSRFWGSLYPSRGDHWKKHVPNEYQKPEMQALLNNFSNISVNRSGSKKVLFNSKSDIMSYYSNQFDFDKGFFEFLEEDYFVKNKYEKVDLTSNFVRSDV